MKSLRTFIERFLSPGALVILTIAIVTSIIVVTLPVEQIEGMPFWVSSKTHYGSYVEPIKAWNKQRPDEKIGMSLLHARALERRMLAGFLSGTPVAEVIETHLGISAKAFLGPVEDVGFVDLTDRLHAEGIYEQINTPSFGPYTSRGRIFGMPHDVHPVLLAYRSDIVEAAGIDVSQIETWEDYFRIMRPLYRDFDGDGRPDHYLMTASNTRSDVAIMLILQAGGTFFDQNARPNFSTPLNAEVLARLVTWFTGPNATCADAPTNTASGHRLRLEGFVVGTLVPDWMVGQWKLETPGLAGKVKVMPIPAWEKGGRRTSVAGGSMIGISKKSPHIETNWEMIKYLYFSPDLARRMYQETSIISPVKTLWSESFYDEPDPYFSGQPIGRMYIEQAPNVPHRDSSPYSAAAGQKITSALINLAQYADKNGIYDEPRLRIEALRLLAKEQEILEQLISRNLFLEPKS